MNNLLEIDENFVPCPVEDGDELYRNGVFVFNISKMLEFIESNPGTFELAEIAIEDFCAEFSSIEESHVDSVDVSRPVIMAEISPGRFNLIDGNHRMEKARRLGLKTLKAFRLSTDQHIRFLTSQKAYEAYVEYWNGKARE